MAKQSKAMKAETIAGEQSPAIEYEAIEIVVGTGKFHHMPEGVDYEVSGQLAKLLIEKGAATLKQ